MEGESERKRRKKCVDGADDPGCCTVKVNSLVPPLPACYPKYLHEFFFGYETERQGSETVAVIFNDGKGVVERMSYRELNQTANLLKDTLLQLSQNTDSFIGVCSELGILYPAIVLGILRSGKGFFNLNPQEWEESIVVGVKQLNLQYLVMCEPLSRSRTSSSSHYRTDCQKQIEGFKMEKVKEVVNREYRIAVIKVTSSRETDTEWKSDNRWSLRYAYAIQTSGTTGKKKTVLVPHSAICPNVYDFVHFRWKMSSVDVVFGSAPPTFDPHIIELFTALTVGASIVYTTTTVKNNNSALAQLLIQHRVSILQMTPSLFRRIYKYYASDFIRVIALGGEKCPSKSELRIMKETICSAVSSRGDIEFQNVYGVTEISCWASVCHIDLSNDDPVTLGDGILETKVFLDDSCEIIINSDTRFCFLVDSLTELPYKQLNYHTGDFGYMLNEDQIVFEGRMDRIVKRNGMKVSLTKIEEMTLATGLVSFAECILSYDMENKIYLIVQLKPEFRTESTSGSTALINSLSKKLDIPLFMYPDRIILLNHIPLNENDKIDLNSVIKMEKENNSTIGESAFVPFIYEETQLVKTMEPIWISCTRPGGRPLVDSLLQENFVEQGGDSISAARFVESTLLTLKLLGCDEYENYERELKQSLYQGTFHSVVILISQIMAKYQNNSIQTNIGYYFYDDLQETQEQLPPLRLMEPTHNDFLFDLGETGMDRDSSYYDCFTSIKEAQETNNSKITTPLHLLNMYNFSLGLCVDASPTVIKGVTEAMGDRVIVGCHGGILLCVDLSVLRSITMSASKFNNTIPVAWKRKFPGRLGAAVVTDKSSLFGFVGCHDGLFYKFSVVAGSVICYFKCEAPIRSKAALSDNHELVIVLDSGNNLYCLNCNYLNPVWERKQSYRFLATTYPVAWKDKCFIFTLENALIAFDIVSGKEVWKVSSPFCSFSHSTPPCLITIRKKCLVMLAGLLTCGDSYKESLIAINGKNGNVEWVHGEGVYLTHPTQSYNQPIYNKCCSVISWLFNSNQTIMTIDPLNGRSISKQYIAAHASKLIQPCLLEVVKKIKNNSHDQCAMFFKLNELNTNKLAIINLHENCNLSEKKIEYKLTPWFMMDKYFETFSLPVTCKEFILFGGRDNKLHVIKCSANKN